MYGQHIEEENNQWTNRCYLHRCRYQQSLISVRTKALDEVLATEASLGSGWDWLQKSCLRASFCYASFPMPQNAVKECETQNRFVSLRSWKLDGHIPPWWAWRMLKRSWATVACGAISLGFGCQRRNGWKVGRLCNIPWKSWQKHAKTIYNTRINQEVLGFRNPEWRVVPLTARLRVTGIAFSFHFSPISHQSWTSYFGIGLTPVRQCFCKDNKF